MIVVDIVDDTSLLSEGVKVLAARTDGAITVRTVAKDWLAFTMHWGFDSDVVVVKAELQDYVPAALKVRALKRLDVRCVVVLAEPSPTHEARLWEAGAAAVLFRSTSLSHLMEVIATDPAESTGGPPDSPRPPADSIPLTDREMQIACLYCGRSAPSTKALGEALGLSTETVRAHLVRTRRRFSDRGHDVSTRTLLRIGLIEDGWLFEGV